MFFTHVHVDHVLGIPDLPDGTPLHAGPGENDDRRAEAPAVRAAVDRALHGNREPSAWPFVSDPAGRFAGVVDVFGDGTVWALWVPGHTRGSTAYLVRTPRGPVLLTGDACHTRWGWEHGVEPGTFSNDQPLSAVSLAQLRTLLAEHPLIDVRLGHQR